MTSNAPSSIASTRFFASNGVYSGPQTRAVLPHEVRMHYDDGPLRSYEIVATRPDGSVFIGQDRAPASPLFESAFSAFTQGTLIPTTGGETAVEDLQPGDLIVRADGASAPLIWIGSSSFIPADTGTRTPLVRVMADSLGQGRPTGFLTSGRARASCTPRPTCAEPPERKKCSCPCAIWSMA